ncbi:MAG: hypothetical protein LIP09_08305 [Bacteroidales bacterium]|nr:hypothetical protein [Bacteroidales bacterium]
MKLNEFSHIEKKLIVGLVILIFSIHCFSTPITLPCLRCKDDRIEKIIAEEIIPQLDSLGLKGVNDIIVLKTPSIGDKRDKYPIGNLLEFKVSTIETTSFRNPSGCFQVGDITILVESPINDDLFLTTEETKLIEYKKPGEVIVLDGYLKWIYLLTPDEVVELHKQVRW